MDIKEISAIYFQPLSLLLSAAHMSHTQNFESNQVQAAALFSLKTGGCPENCSYCPQSAHYETGLKREKMLSEVEVLAAAQLAQKNGATRFCMGAAWRSVKDGPEFEQVLQLVKSVRSGTGMEVCCTLGMLNEQQALRLKEAGLTAYNHNIDTSRNYYTQIVQTRTYDDRLQTLKKVHAAGLAVCTGGILGLGESEQDRIEFIHQLTNLDFAPESITINTLVPFEGTPLAQQKPVHPLEVVRVIATIRLTNPKAMIRLSAGRLQMSDEAQFLCFYAGANSIFLGDKLLTSPNPQTTQDHLLMSQCGFELSTSNHEL